VAAYRNEALITGYAVNGAAISSSTEPSLMVRMLDLLDVHDGQKVLEIGTGTGYNAALLAHRLGPDNVTTIDIDPRLTQTAKTVLDNAGYPVTVLTGNGAHGAAEHAPFERIIATCGVDRILAAWIEQLAPGGLVLANVSRGLIVLQCSASDTVSGRFCGQAGFMALHAANESPPPTSGEIFDVTTSRPQRQHDADVPADLDFTIASFLASLIAERSHLMFVHREGGAVVDYRWWHPASASWVRVELRDSGPARIHETGTRQL
jgi:protein-L-isoaspartate O-methyltransferase